MTINEKYSFTDFMGQSFKDKPASDFNKTEIKGSCFYQEAKEKDAEVLKDIFPDGMMGVVFKRCDLNNVFVPPGNVVEDNCSHRRLKIQNDGCDWVLDDGLKPIEPTDKKQRLREGWSISPKDIPAEYIREEVIIKSDWDLTYGRDIVPEKSWFKEVPQILSQQTSGVTSEIDKRVWDSLPPNHYMYFDGEPALIGVGLGKKKVLARDDKGIPQRDSEGKPIVLGIQEIEIIKLRGNVTRYTVRGKGRLTR